MVKKIIIAIVSCFLFSLIVATIAYLMSDQETREMYPLFSSMIVIMFYSVPFFLLIGIPYSYLVDFLEQKKQFSFVSISLIYIMGGIIAAGAVRLFFGFGEGSLAVFGQLCIQFGGAAFMFLLVATIFKRMGLLNF
ncbi:hypothetical protein ACFFIS_14595 [Virgibacillus soli]|uniref:Uncharacterized protein n=1 Tax=Paracerasibacillus soli TaxID=480284 RepID=A0ABU5CVA3_9BACI|nr:hypothetical protein [Virgibacillus soli]MDY0410314.1 hypothetical protein [Virgibacillus soli]